MSGIFTSEQAELFASPHVCRGILLDVELPSGTLRMHNGVGTINIGGNDYRGVSYPQGGRLVKIGVIPHPEFGQAAAVDIVLAGADLAFFKTMDQIGRDIEGNAAVLYFVMFDQETQKPLFDPVSVFPRATISAPKLLYGPGLGRRDIAVTIEGPFADINFPAMGRWSGAGQRGRYSGDKGQDLMGVEAQEILKP